MSFFERLKAEALAEWRAYTEHSFTKGMADGSLPEAAFRHYLVQDYLFLIEFARAYALSVYSLCCHDAGRGHAGDPTFRQLVLRRRTLSRVGNNTSIAAGAAADLSRASACGIQPAAVRGHI